MSLQPLPRTAAWQHLQARSGFEVVFFDPLEDGCRARGCTTAVEDGSPWVVEYDIRLDACWHTRRCAVRNRTSSGGSSTLLETDGVGRWRVDGVEAPHLDGCLDVDLESSALTNAFPMNRLRLPVGARAEAPAAFVRALDLAVERLDQTYVRISEDGPQARDDSAHSVFDSAHSVYDSAHSVYDYAAAAFDVRCRLVYDEAGLLLEYPGLAVRADQPH